MMTEKTYQDQFEAIWIKREMIKKALQYVEAQKELKNLKKNNRKDYDNQYNEYIDEIKGF